MNLKNWAAHEVELALSYNTDEYYGMCLKAALEAYKLLCSQGHSGTSMSVTASILNRLIQVKPLSPIEDTSDVWNEYEKGKYQCNRYTALFKDILEDDTCEYHDVDRFVCYEVKDKEKRCPFHSGTVDRALNSLFPITFPYEPERYEVMVQEDLVDPKNGDFDTVCILKITTPKGDVVYPGKYFTEKKGKMVEISKRQWRKLVCKPAVLCKDCKHLDVESGGYATCAKAYKGIVNSHDSCPWGVKKES